MYQVQYFDKDLIVHQGTFDKQFTITDSNVNITLPHNKFFDGEILDQNLELVKSDIRSNKLVGFFSTSAKTTFGKSKSGKKIYQLTCLDHKLPYFKLPYGGKIKGKILVIFKFLNWNDKLPQATIVDVIGLFNEENIIRAYIYFFELDQKRMKINPKRNLLEDNISRIDDVSLYTISIDPLGSQDIDDAISMDEEFLYIHIAQPISYMNVEDITQVISKRFSTLYLGDKEISLFGDKITNMASLLKGKIRNCYTLKFNNSGDLVAHYPGLVKLNKNLSYSFVNQNKDQFKRLFDFSKNIFGNIDSAQKLVEQWMVHTNCAIGNSLDETIYRSNNTDINILSNLDEESKKYFYDSSTYNFSNNSNHNILNKSNYLHFTSPIRRLVDNFVHYQLTYNNMILNKEDLVLSLPKINSLSKKTNKFHRTLQLRKKINHLPEISDSVGKIIEINENYIKILIPNLGLFNHFTKNKYGNILDITNLNLSQEINLKIGVVNNIFPNKMLMISTEFDLDLIEKK